MAPSHSLRQHRWCSLYDDGVYGDEKCGKRAVEASIEDKKIEKVTMDSGTNLIELKRMAEISNGLLQFKEAVVHQVNSQYQNYCERSVQMVKKVVRMMMQKLTNQKLPVLLREEAV